MYKGSIREEFVLRRKEGASLGVLKSEFGIAKSTASLWARSIQVENAGKVKRHSLHTKVKLQANAQKARLIHECNLRLARKKSWEAGNTQSVSGNDALLVGIYWGEGYKLERLFHLINSDFNMVLIASNWLRNNGFNQLRLKIQCCEGDKQREGKIKEFWARCVGVSPETVRVYYKKTTGKSSRNLIYGVAHLSCKGAVLAFERLSGIASQMGIRI